ncbi:MAG: phosphate ABC transporter substrate-binding protein [Methanobacteriota archaeon]
MSMSQHVPVKRLSALVGIAGLLVVLILIPASVSAEGKSLTISGSTTVLPIASAVAEAYMAKNPDIDVKVSGGGSGVGISAIGKNTVDIGMSSRDLNEDEKAAYSKLVVTPIAKDGVAIIINPANPVESLTLAQIKDIYTGTTQSWNDVGGSKEAFDIVGRDSASGTREFFFNEVMKKADFTPFMLEKNSNGAVQQLVSQTANAIGYVGMGFEDGVKVLSLNVDGKMLKPSATTVKSGEYPLSRNLYFLTSGEPSGAAKDFIDFLLSADGQKIIEENGFVSIN